MFQDSEHKEEYHAPWCLQWIVCYLILLFDDFFLHSSKMVNIIFKAKIKSYLPRFLSTIYFSLNFPAFCYTEYNNPLFYKQCMLSVLIFWHKKRILRFFPVPSFVTADTEGSHHQHRFSPFSPWFPWEFSCNLVRLFLLHYRWSGI